MKIVDPYDEAFFARLAKRFPNLGWRVKAIEKRRWDRWGNTWAESTVCFSAGAK